MARPGPKSDHLPSAGAELREAVLPPFYRRMALDEVGSTNDEALRLAAEGAEEGVLVTAVRQTRGRGRRGRVWESPSGNLHLSLVLRPENVAESAVPVGFAASLAVAEAVGELLPGSWPVQVKWPNDVLLDGRKVSGILVEWAASALVLGVGVNVACAPEVARYPAAALAFAGSRHSVEDALGAFCRCFLHRYRQLLEDGFEPLRNDWLSMAYGLGKPFGIDVEGRRFDGKFLGIDPDGALRLDLGNGKVKKITAGDVGFPGAVGTGPC